MMRLSSVSKNTEQLEYPKQSQSEVLFSEKIENASLNFLHDFKDTRSKQKKIFYDCYNLQLNNTKTQPYSYKQKPFVKPILKITVSRKNPARRLSRTSNKQEYYKKVETSISNHESSLQNLHLQSIKEKRKQKIYEIKKSESDILHYKYNNTKYAAYKCEDLNFWKMENNNRKDIKTTRIKRTNKDCNCETSDYKLENDRKNRVTIVGQLGLTQDERYVLKCAATVNNKPVPTNFSESVQNPDRVLKQNTFNDAETQATQVDFNFSRKNKKSYKNRFVQCDCGGGKVDAAISKANVLKECNSPLVVISVYPRQGETEDTDYCPVKIVQHQNFSKNNVKTKLETEIFKDNDKQNRDRNLPFYKRERLRASRSPSPVNKTENTYTSRTKESKPFAMSDVSRKQSPENKSYKIGNKPNEFKREVFRVNEQNKYNKISSFNKQSNKFERKVQKTDAEHVKRTLVNDFLKNIDKIDKRQPKVKVISAKDDASKITINIDGDNEKYDVTLERSDFDTGVTVRKSAKHKKEAVADVSSMQNYLMLTEEDIGEASHSRRPIDKRNMNMATDSRLNVRDSLEINHRRGQKNSSYKMKNDIKLKDEDYYAPLKHFRGDNCSITDPNERDKEIRELLGVLRDSKKSNITSDKQDKDNCVKTCYEGLMTGHRIGSLLNININENKDMYQNSNSLVPLKKEESIKPFPNYCILTKSCFNACYTNNLIVPQNLVITRHIQVFMQLDPINKIRPVILTSTQYQKVKRHVQRAVSKKLSIERKSRYVTNTNDLYIGDVTVKQKVHNTLHFDREVQTEQSAMKKIARHAKRKYHQNTKVFDEILNNSNSVKHINKASVCECKHTKEKHLVYNDYRHVVSSIEIGKGCRACRDVMYVKATPPSYVMESEKKSVYSLKQHNSIHTIFKGYRRSVTPNLGTSAISLDSERTASNNSIKPFGAGDCKTKKPFLRRLISCLVMRPAQTSELKAETPGKDRVRLSNSVDSYHINTSLGAFEMSSSLYDTSVSFYSNHTTMPLNKIKRGLFTSVREFLTGRRT